MDALFAAYAVGAPDRDLCEQALSAVMDQLANVHGIALTDQDKRDVRDLMTLFFNSGPTVKNTANWGDTVPAIPTYVGLMTARDPRGQQQSYLATEEHFRIVQELQRRNLVVPIVGDFAGDKALKSVGEYLKGYRARVGVFYISNVEHSLNTAELYARFYSNVQQLPIDGSSVFIRSTTANSDRRLEIAMPPRATFFRSVLANIAETLERFREGRLTYKDAVLMSK